MKQKYCLFIYRSSSQHRIAVTDARKVTRVKIAVGQWQRLDWCLMTDSTWHDGAVAALTTIMHYWEWRRWMNATTVSTGRLHEWRTEGRAQSPATADWVKTICCQPARNDDVAKLCFNTQQTRLILADVLPSTSHRVFISIIAMFYYAIIQQDRTIQLNTHTQMHPPKKAKKQKKEQN